MKNNHHSLSKNHFNQNIPKTPCRKTSFIKEPKQKLSPKYFGSLIQKEPKSKINNKKNYNLYSSSILNKNMNNIEPKNNEFKCKDIKSFSNSRDYKSYLKDKKINLSNKNNKKKNDYLYFFENYKTKKNAYKQNNEINLETKENPNKINKTQSFVNNSNQSYNNYNYIHRFKKHHLNQNLVLIHYY